MIAIRALLVLLLVVAGAATLARQPAAQAETPTVYIALGDSIAYGIGSSLPRKRGYPALVANYLETWTGSPVELHNLAVPGETSATFLNDGQLDEFRQLIATDPTIVSVSLGGNEMLDAEDLDNSGKQAALDDFATAYDAALGEIRSITGNNAQIVVTTNYDLSEGDPEREFTDAWWVGQFNNVIIETARTHGAIVADIESAFRGNIDTLTLHPWDVHPKNRGFLAIARQVWSALGLDQEPPEVSVVSGLSAGRTLRTIQLQITDADEIGAVSVEIGDHPARTPATIGNDTWVLLVDLRDETGSTLPVVVRATDRAGNERTIEVELTVNAD